MGRHVISAVGQPEPSPEGYLNVFFTQSERSRAAGAATLGRIFGPKENPDTPTTWETRQAQYDAVCSWGVPNHSLLHRLTAIQTPVLIAAGDRDPMILPRYSYLLAGMIPNAVVKIYPDAAHGFLFQHYAEFADDVRSFLDNS